MLNLGLLPSEQQTNIALASGVNPGTDIDDVSLETSAVAHVFKGHGNTKVEASRGQRPIEPSDFARLPQLIQFPDSVDATDPAPGKPPRFQYRKSFGLETLVAIFEMRTNRQRFALVTMWVEKSGAFPASRFWTYIQPICSCQYPRQQREDNHDRDQSQYRYNHVGA